MATHGNWSGNWLGDWHGPPESNPGSISGVATLSITATGNLSESPDPNECRTTALGFDGTVLGFGDENNFTVLGFQTGNCKVDSGHSGGMFWGGGRPVKKKRQWIVKIGKHRYSVDPDNEDDIDDMHAAIAFEAKRAAEELSANASAEKAAKRDVKPVGSIYDPQWSKFIEKIRSDYESALRTALIAKIYREQEDDDEESLMLLL